MASLQIILVLCLLATTSSFVNRSILIYRKSTHHLFSEVVESCCPVLPTKRQINSSVAALVIAASFSLGVGVSNSCAFVEPSSILVSSDADVEKALSDLKNATDADQTLQAMIQVNQLLENDDGTMESPVVREEIVRNLGLVKGTMQSNGTWRDDINFAYGVLRWRLDPYSTLALRPYLNVAPYLGGLYYLAALFVQQTFPSSFPAAYLSLVGIFIFPVLFVLFNT